MRIRFPHAACHDFHTLSMGYFESNAVMVLMNQVATLIRTLTAKAYPKSEITTPIPKKVVAHQAAK